MRITADDLFRKALLLAAASYFERELVGSVLDYVGERAHGDPLVVAFVERKALARQYHALFEWGGSNANKFFGLFGSEFREFMKMKLESDPDLTISVAAFMELGSERNRLVHEDFGNFTLEKTSEEIYSLYEKGLGFVGEVKNSLLEFALQEGEI